MFFLSFFLSSYYLTLSFFSLSLSLPLSLSLSLFLSLLDIDAGDSSYIIKQVGRKNRKFVRARLNWGRIERLILRRSSSTAPLAQ